MAFNNTLHDLNSLDFGDVLVGESATLQIVFTNDSDPTASQDITLATTAPFSIASGDEAFTLAADAATHTVDITYTPTAAGDDVEDLTGTTTADAFVDALPITLTGHAYTNIYPLAEIANNNAGVMKIDLIVDPSIADGLTVPTDVCVAHIGELVELIDVQPGIVDVQNLDLELYEDYSTYAEGFWYHVIQGDPTKEVSFRFILEEDGTDTFYFWGHVTRQEAVWPEIYIKSDETEVVRIVTLKLISVVHALKEIPVAGLLTEIRLHKTTFGGLEQEYYKIQDQLDAIVSVGFSQAFASGNAIVRACDFTVNAPPAGDFSLEDTYIGTPTGLGEHYVDGDADPETNPKRWDYQFANIYDVLRAICLSCGWIARHFYGQADGSYAGDGTDEHYLEFVTRGTAYGTFVTPEEGIAESQLTSDNTIKEQNIRVADIVYPGGVGDDLGSGQSWAIDGAEYNAPDPNAASVSDAIDWKEPPLHTDFNLDIGTQFILNPTYEIFSGPTPTTCFRAFQADDSGTRRVATTGRYYNYDTAAWTPAVGPFIENYTDILMRYYNARFSGVRKSFERTYASMRWDNGTTVSHVNLKPMVRIQIDDQIATENYYATEIRKDFESSSSTVLWIAE